MQITTLDLPPCDLGESPLWCPASQSFYWVDGLAPALYRMSWASRRIERQVLPDTVGSITRGMRGWIVLALAKGLARVRFGLAPEPVVAPEDLPAGVRFNDSKVDPWGRIVAGTMDLGEVTPRGAAYRFDQGQFQRVDDGYVVFNGPCWSPDGHSLYMSDSAARRVWRFDYAASGKVSNKRLWFGLAPAEGLPDGATVDADGVYWQARNGAGKLVAHGAQGQVLQEVGLPTANVTSLAFGGPGLDAVLVTSMNRLLPGQAALDAAAGRVFLIEGLGARGRVEPAAKWVRERVKA